MGKAATNITHVALLSCLLLCASCVALHRGAAFRVIPHQPDYLLQCPDAHKTPFGDVLRAYNGYERGQSWADLRPLMELRIENAYYQPGASRQGLKGFLGTEVARYEVRAKGLRLFSFTSMAHRPPRDLPVHQLIAPEALRRHFYRFYYEVFFPGSKETHGSVILGADSMPEMERLSEQMSRPESICYSGAAHCTVFPQACTVSLQMKITVNGTPRSVNWGGMLGMSLAIFGNLR